MSTSASSGAVHQPPGGGLYLEDVGAADADLALAGDGEVLHLGHVHQLDLAAGQGWAHVVGRGVSLQCQRAGRHTLCLAVPLQHLSTGASR